MEVMSSCVFLNVILVIAQTEHSISAQRADRALPYIFPDRFQFFEYESVTVRCELTSGNNTWRVMREVHKARSTNFSDSCSSPAPSCTIKPALEKHSGEYWCQNDEGERSGSVNISITAGLVILDIPTQPVVEGSNVTLPCIHKETELKDKLKTELNHIRDFYRNGLHLVTRYIGSMNIENVSKADEGFYKCSISGAGESPESWLAVQKPHTEPVEESPPIKNKWTKAFILETTVKLGFTVLFSVVIGLTYYKKYISTESNGFFSGKQTRDPKETKAEATDSAGPCLSEEEVH